MTSTLALQIRGNTRAKREDVLGLVVEGVEKLFGESTPSCTPGSYITTSNDLSTLTFSAARASTICPDTCSPDTVSNFGISKVIEHL